jgi:phenylacetate-coenzyme A ligase PaaK-like adenylate-forming protein
MPFIRYDLGDYAKISEVPCSCGRGNLLVMPDGSRVWPPLGPISKSLVKELAYRDVQFIQTSIGSLAIKYVPADPDVRPNVRAIEKLVQSELNAEFELQLIPVDRIERGPGRKIEQFISLVPEAAAAVEVHKSARSNAQ